MLGVFLTIVAVFLVICFALCYPDQPSGDNAQLDADFYISPRNAPSNGNGDRFDPGHGGPVTKRRS